MNSSVGGIVEATKFKWRINIDRFRDKPVGFIMISPQFHLYNKHNGFENKWQLEMYPKGTEKYPGGLSLYLGSLNREQVFASFSLSVLNKDGGFEVHRVVKNHLFQEKGSNWGYPQFADAGFIDDPQNFSEDNTITIMCKIILQDNIVEEEVETTCTESSCRIKEFEPSFERLFINREFSDVTISVGRRTLKLHKCILSTRSPVFEAMFRNNMKEKNQSVVQIKDIRYEVLQELFRFIYTGKVNKIEEVVEELLLASEKYCIEGLKALCEKTMCDNINDYNVFTYLNAAVLNNSEKLKKFILDWIILHLESLIQKPEFENFASLYPQLLVEVMKKSLSM